MPTPQKARCELIQAAGDDMPVLMLYGDIGDDWDGVTARIFREQLMAIDAPEFELQINSGGGAVFEGIDIYNAIVQHPAKAHGVVHGQCGSIASVILQACDTRRMPDNTHLMVHYTIGGAYGHADDLEDYLKLMRNSDEITKRIYAARSGQSLDAIAELLSRDRWMTAAEALEQGLIDDVIAASKGSPHVTPEHLAAPSKTRPVDRRQIESTRQTLAAIAAHLPSETTAVANQPADKPVTPAQQNTPPKSPAADAPQSSTAPSSPATPDQPVAPSQATPAANQPAATDPNPIPPQPATLDADHAAQIAEICTMAGLSNRIGEFLRNRHTVDQVRQFALQHVCQSRALTPDPTGDAPQGPPAKKLDDPQAKFAAEYESDAAIFQAQGISKEQYVQTRLVDEGHAVLQAFGQRPKQPPAAAA